MNLTQATVFLFNGLCYEGGRTSPLSIEVLERTVRNGYLLSPGIIPNETMLNDIESVVGLSGKKMNSSFHKSWMVVRDADIMTLFIQQIIHYITTYGFERLGIYDEAAVYIPNEELEIPELKENIPLIYIKAFTADEILEKIITLGSGVALAKQTLGAIMTIVVAMRYHPNFVEQIKNRELKGMLIDHYGLTPTEPVEFLRHVILKLTDESLLIKNQYLLNKIKEANGKFLDELMKNAPKNLASIFYRFKPIFLAFKSISKNKTFYNDLRRKAKTMHVPLPEDFLNSVTAKLKTGDIHSKILLDALSKVNIYRKIRLANALLYRLDSPDTIVYRIRNGRGWIEEFDWPETKRDITEKVLKIIKKNIADSLNVKGKTFYIPAGIVYAMPATEKQFTGNLPTGSYVSVSENLVVGIHWTNNSFRVDLDLSLLGTDMKYGWDANYRSNSRSILFSGDVTDARKPNGASEMFFIDDKLNESFLLNVNYYNYRVNNPVNCKIFAASEKTPTRSYRKNHMVDPNNVKLSTAIEITEKQNFLALITRRKNENRVYFANINIGNAISSRSNEASGRILDYLVGCSLNNLKLNDILTIAGAEITHEKPNLEQEIDYIDLSPDAIDKSTFINLMNEEK